MSAFISRYALFISIATSISIYLLSIFFNWTLEISALISAVCILIFALVLEVFIPYKNEWKINTGDLKNDLTSAVVLLGIAEPLIKLAATTVVIFAYSSLNLEAKAGILSNAQVHLGLEIVLVTLLIEFGLYWSHRLHHMLAPLWQLHAMHHSSKRLYAINNFRFHPLNYGLNFSAGMLPAMLLGFSPEALFAYIAISQPVLMLQHANIDLKSGSLNYIFSTNELHRWHHSSAESEANSNYGTSIVLWDQVFGTYRATTDRDNAPKHLGLFSSSRGYPENGNYFEQLIVPFKRGCC